MKKDFDYFYLVRRDNKFSFTVTKWVDGETLPHDEYRLQEDTKGHLSCSCPSGSHRRYCHHTAMVRTWVAMGEPEGEEMRKAYD